MITRRLAPHAILLAIGIGWGLTVPLSKIAVSGGRGAFGLIVWQSAIAALTLGLVMLVTRRRRPRGRAWRICLAISLVGTLLPNAVFYTVARHLPAGVMALLLSTVPMLAFPVALALGNDRFRPVRLAGLGCGLVGVLLIALPGASLPGAGSAAWLPLALIAPLFYALEGNIVAKWGTMGLDSIQLLFGSSLIGTALATPVALASGEWINPAPPWAAPDYALMLTGLISAGMYASYVWLIGRTGAVFAGQVSYFITGAGVLWSVLLLGERFSLWVWAALALMLGGLALVQPRPAAEACQAAPVRQASAESI